MRVFLFKDYDRFSRGKVHVFDRHIGIALCRNENAFGFPADASAFKACGKMANKDQLKVWARGMGIPTSQTSDELKAALFEIAGAA